MVKRLKENTILITGGAGFLGINLIRYLLNKRFTNIRSLDMATFDYPERDRIQTILGDIRDRETVRKAVQDVDWVVHAAAALPLYSKEDIYSTDIQGTEYLLEEAFQAGIDRFIHISSTAVYGIPDHSPILETDALEGVGFYGQAKIQAEKLCSAYRHKGLTVSILRPKSFIGPERLGAFELLYNWACDGRNFPIVGNGSNRYQLLDVKDLCHAICLCAIGGRDKTNGTFNIGAREFSSLRQDFQAVLDEAGFGKKVVPFPRGLSVAVLRLMELLHLSPIYKWIYKTAGKDSCVAIEKAEKLLGFHPRHTNQQALLRNYHWYLDNRCRLNSAAAGVSHRTPWHHGVLRFLRIFF